MEQNLFAVPNDGLNGMKQWIDEVIDLTPHSEAFRYLIDEDRR
jgi:hypothetical protein